jgi:hypothetical protein
MRIFTQSKMKELLKMDVFRHLFEYYANQIVDESGFSSRLYNHKSMGKNYEKYMGVLRKVLSIN